MRRKKWIYIILIVLLTMSVLVIYNELNGNPIGKQLSKSTLKSYLTETYPDEEFRISQPFYNFKSAGYDFTATRVGESNQKEYHFTVTGILGSKVDYDEIYYINQDHRLIAKLQKEATEELTSLLLKKVPELLEIAVYLEILKGTYDADITWNKNLETEKPINFYIGLDSRNFKEEEFLEAAMIIQNALNSEGYAYKGVTIDGKIPNEEPAPEIEYDPNFWHVKYLISFEKNSTLKMKMITQHSE